MNEVKGSLDKTYNSLLTRVDVVFLVAIVVALVIAFFYGIQIVKPLKKIQVFSTSLSEGDLTATVEVKSKNEIGQMAESLIIAQQHMRGLIQDITGIAQGVNDALGEFESAFNDMKGSINEVSSAVDSIASNVSDQAASIDGASCEVDVMGKRIEDTETEIATLGNNAKDMERLSEQSMATLNKLIEVNNDTRENINAMYEQTEITNKSAQEIQIAANLINEISDQTSLLALNASIEAARAGELGKGFAVVAGEIGNLAQQSAKSVEEIRRVVNELLSNAGKSVDVMREINESVDIQVSSLTDTQDIFSKLHKELDNCVNSVNSIDSMTDEIESQRANVTQSLSTLNNLAQDNAAVAEETSAMSVELSKLVDDSSEIVDGLEEKVKVLIENVEKFKI